MSLKNIKTTKRKKPRRSSRITKSAKSMVPVWDGWEEWDGQKFHRFKTSSQSWFYQTFKHTELHPHLFNWMLKNDYTKKDVQACKALPNWKLSTSVCINAKMLLDGMPDFNKKEDEYWQSLAGTMGEVRPVTVHMKKSIQEWIEEGSTLLKNKKVEEKKKADVYVPSIQERIREQASMASEDIDVWLDELRMTGVKKEKDGGYKALEGDKRGLPKGYDRN